ncbi:MAG TPA: choice-of-anchor J domain-containing protein, partial [Anaerolineae bacterium]|nr:choice-of-anchor J domain-containing protein [Anaerolineae bacterium]
PLVTHPGGGAGGADASALQTALLLSTYGFGNQASAGNRVADDFTVTGGGWLIDTMTFFGYQTGSSTTSTFTALNLRIWDGPPNDPGSMVVFGDTTTNRLASTTWANMYRTLDTALTNTDRPVMALVATVNTFLPAGTYWVDWQANGTLASGPWAPPISIVGQTTTGNAWQFTSTGWAPLVDGTFAQGLPFIVEGLADCSNLSDVPWLSVSPANGVNAGGTNTVGTVSFDSTGLANGTYTARMCVFSNDRDPGPGNGTGLVIVPVTLNVGGAAGISLVKTVGTTPGVCAATSSITVLAGTTVYYCYTVTNTGSVALNLHTLVDDQLGTIFSGLNYALAPGASVNTVAAGLSIPAVINATTTNVGTWTAYNTGGPSVQATATATVTATPRTPNIDVDPLSLAATQPTNTTTQQTLDVGNTGNADLTWAIAEEPASVLAQATAASPAVPASVASDTGSRGAPSSGPAPIEYTSLADFSEGFDDITVLPGWFFQNNSAPLGLTDWFQGNDTVFPAQAGAATAYIGANYNNTG